MKLTVSNSIKFFIFPLLSLGILGTVFFFPLNINSRYTCLYHRYSSSGEAMPYTNGGCSVSVSTCGNAGSGAQAQLISVAPDEPVSPEADSPTPDSHQSHLLRQYLKSYAYWWWGSLILLLVGGYAVQKWFFRKNRAINKENSPLPTHGEHGRH